MGDRKAINQVPLGRLVEELPGLYCAIGDCVYTPTEHLIPIFRGENALSARNRNNFNFFGSQLCIRIEMAFGLMVKKWGILARPLTIKLKNNIKRLVFAIAKLHKHLYQPTPSNGIDKNGNTAATTGTICLHADKCCIWLLWCHVERRGSLLQVWWTWTRIRKSMVEQSQQNGKGNRGFETDLSWWVVSTPYY